MSHGEKENPWFEWRFNKLEINPMSQDCTINICANQKITIDKLYGPLAAYPVRIYLQYDKNSNGEWVFEYKNPKTDQWEEKSRFNCQENWPENE